MSYVKTINEDGVVSDIMAKALDPELDAAVLKRTNLVNGFTQTEAGVNALDAAAGKSLNDSLTPVSHTGYSFVGYSQADQNMCYVYIVGKICIYSLAFKGGTSETTPGHTDTFVTGMPKPLHDSYGNGMSYTGAATQNFRYRVTSSGSTGIITNYYSGMRVYTNNPVIMTGAYIIA